MREYYARSDAYSSLCGGAYTVGVRIPNIGEIVLNLGSVMYADGVYYISGHDSERKNYTLQCSHISIQDDLSAHYGWVNIMGYWIGSKFTACQCYSSIS